MKTKSLSKKLDHLLEEILSLYPFYQKYRSSSMRFEELPFTDKKLLTNLRDQFELPNQNIAKESFTSGTTGIPFRCIKTANEHFKLSLAIFKQRKKWGLPTKHRKLLMSNRILSETNVLGHYARVLKEKSPHMIQGRTSAIVSLCQYLERNDLPVPTDLKFVQNWGEPLNAGQRSYVESILNVPFVDYYGMEEIWGIAYSNQQMELEIDEDAVYIEVIDPQSGERVPEGEYGEIVVTSFVMRSLPFVRYRNGDIGKVLTDEKTGKKIIQLLPVRSSQIQLPDRQVSAAIFRYLDRFFYELALSQEIRQFQIIQESYTEFRLKVAGKLQQKEQLKEKLRSFLNSSLSTEVTLYIEQVDRIPPHPVSGKVQSFISFVS